MRLAEFLLLLLPVMVRAIPETPNLRGDMGMGMDMDMGMGMGMGMGVEELERVKRGFYT